MQTEKLKNFLQVFHFLSPSNTEQTIRLWNGDILNEKNKFQEYDCVIATEVIEHIFEKDVPLFKYEEKKKKFHFLNCAEKFYLKKYHQII